MSFHIKNWGLTGQRMLSVDMTIKGYQVVILEGVYTPSEDEKTNMTH